MMTVSRHGRFDGATHGEYEISTQRERPDLPMIHVYLGTNSCVWELEITKHERDTWVTLVLANPSQPAFEDYLKDRLEISP